MDENIKKEESVPLTDKFAELEKKSEEYLNNWKRSAADFINYKKEEIDRMAMLAGYAKESMILKVLPIFDSIYLLKQHTDKLEDVSLSEGVLQIEKQMREFLKKEGIEEIEVLGKPFNPEIMEAVGEVEDTDEGSAEGGDEGTIVEELQKGYKVGGKVLRPAKVKVTK